MCGPPVGVQDRREYVIQLWSNAEAQRVKLEKVLRGVEELTAQSEQLTAGVVRKTAKLKSQLQLTTDDLVIMLDNLRRMANEYQTARVSRGCVVS